MTKRNAVAVQVPHYDDIKKRAGYFIFTGLHGIEGDHYGMLFACPCGCGAYGSLTFDNIPKEWAEKNKPRAQWHWDGNIEKPTVTPSILHEGHWHGFLRNGVFEEC